MRVALAALSVGCVDATYAAVGVTTKTECTEAKQGQCKDITAHYFGKEKKGCITMDAGGAALPGGAALTDEQAKAYLKTETPVHDCENWYKFAQIWMKAGADADMKAKYAKVALALCNYDKFNNIACAADVNTKAARLAAATTELKAAKTACKPVKDKDAETSFAANTEEHAKLWIAAGAPCTDVSQAHATLCANDKDVTEACTPNTNLLTWLKKLCGETDKQTKAEAPYCKHAMDLSLAECGTWKFAAKGSKWLNQWTEKADQSKCSADLKAYTQAYCKAMGATWGDKPADKKLIERCTGLPSSSAYSVSASFGAAVLLLSSMFM